MTSAGDIHNTFVDNQPVRVLLPLCGSTEMLRADCIYRPTTLPNFDLHFPAGILPVTSLDLKKTAIVSNGGDRQDLPLEARIRAVRAEGVLEMEPIDALDHRRMREYFRVEAAVAVVARSLPPELGSRGKKPWSRQGTTIDISGNGVLAVFAEKPPADEAIRLEITLPAGSPGTVAVPACPVRSHDADAGMYEVAYRFEDIADHDRDRIIACCLVLQRRLLRLSPPPDSYA